jgi:hypothetical protein
MSSSKYHFEALGSEEKNSRCRHQIHTEIVSTCVTGEKAIKNGLFQLRADRRS